jgi:undecaprenyl-diphosphatase
LTADHAIRRRAIAFVMVSILATLIAAIFDAAVARAMQKVGFGPFIRSHMWLREIITAPGWIGFTLIVAIVVARVHRDRLTAGALVLSAGTFTAVNEIIKWLVGRIRPFKIDEAGERLAPFEFQPCRFYYVKNLCFTSGHTALSFATAAALGMLWPRWRPLWYSIAAFVAIERVAENAHWLSDVVAGAALGIGGAYFVAWLIRRIWKIEIPTPPPTCRS